jgi:hypothetical protein
LRGYFDVFAEETHRLVVNALKNELAGKLSLLLYFNDTALTTSLKERRHFLNGAK